MSGGLKTASISYVGNGASSRKITTPLQPKIFSVASEGFGGSIGQTDGKLIAWYGESSAFSLADSDNGKYSGSDYIDVGALGTGTPDASISDSNQNARAYNLVVSG